MSQLDSVKRCIYIFHKFKSQKKCKSCAQDMTERIWFHRAKQTSNIVRNICNWSNPTRALRLFSLDAVLVRLLLSFSLLVAVCINIFFFVRFVRAISPCVDVLASFAYRECADLARVQWTVSAWGRYYLFRSSFHACYI